MWDLFRKEAVEYQRVKWVGKALLISGIPTWIISVLSILFVLILLTLLVFGNYTRRINVYGEITTQPRSVNIFAPQQGFISQRFINVGEVVEKGQRLYQIDVSQVTESGKVSANTRHALENQLAQVDNIIQKLRDNKRTTLDNIRMQKQQYEAAHQQSKRVLDNVRQGVEFAKNNMQSYKDYQQRGLITKDQLSSQTYSYYQQQSLFQNLYSQHIKDSLQITNLDSEIVTRAADFDNQVSQYELQRNNLQGQLAEVNANGTLIINAPTNGRIESLSVTLGQMVNMGDSLAQLTPNINATYYLVLWLPNSSIPYVSVGDVINIRYDAFPFEKFGQFSGRIENIAYAPASIQEMATYSSPPVHQSNAQTESYYKVMVALDKSRFSYQGKELQLTNGMRAQSTLFLEKRPLYQWMFSSFYDMKKSLMGPVHD
ncbi:HlyD family secretion protein [Photorhabdus asymbiotica]